MGLSRRSKELGNYFIEKDYGDKTLYILAIPKEGYRDYIWETKKVGQSSLHANPREILKTNYENKKAWGK